MDSQTLAARFHEAYERLAPQFGYSTREDTRKFDPDSANGKLMIAVCAEVLGKNLPYYEQWVAVGSPYKPNKTLPPPEVLLAIRVLATKVGAERELCESIVRHWLASLSEDSERG